MPDGPSAEPKESAPKNLGNSERAAGQSGGRLSVRRHSQERHDFSVRRTPVIYGSYFGSFNKRLAFREWRPNRVRSATGEPEGPAMFEAVMAGPVTAKDLVAVESPGDALLASFDLFSYLGIHSKTSVFRGRGICRHFQYVQNAEGFRVLSCNDPSEPIRVRSFKALGTLAMTAVDKVTIKAAIRTIVAMRLFVLMFGFLCFVGLSAAALHAETRDISRNEAACLRNAGRGGKT